MVRGGVVVRREGVMVVRGDVVKVQTTQNI